MKAIWKFPIPIDDSFTVQMPSGAKPLHVGTDPTGQIAIWAMVESDSPLAPMKFLMRGTGHPCDGIDAASHLGSFVTASRFVWHVFTVTP